MQRNEGVGLETASEAEKLRRVEAEGTEKCSRYRTIRAGDAAKTKPAEKSKSSKSRMCTRKHILRAACCLH